MALSSPSATADSNRERRLLKALALSFLIHLLILSLLNLPQAPEVPPIEISLLDQPPPLQKQERRDSRQLVSPSDAPEQAPLVETPLRSDKDSRAERQTLKKGMPDAGPTSAPNPVQPPVAVPPQPSPRPKSTAATQPKPQDSAAAPPKEGSVKPTESDRTLRLSGTDLLKTLEPSTESAAKERLNSTDRLQAVARGETPPGPQPRTDSERVAALERYQPFRKESLAALFAGKAGSPDLLPTVQDGEVTMLNAKAERHAVFVRRVALQVFGALRQLSWSEVPFEQIRSARGFVTVHAVMSSKGKLIRVELRDSSGSTIFDNVLVQAANRGVWDQNPPPTAQTADGTIRFVFMARSWSRFVGDARQEQRWLLLSTGLL
ncbi:MAG: energy transducer TonB [Bdellovibrionales bacterium]|nr:energy transducer TonB [Bdellovibrionales bacterium]